MLGFICFLCEKIDIMKTKFELIFQFLDKLEKEKIINEEEQILLLVEFIHSI